MRYFSHTPFPFLSLSHVYLVFSIQGSEILVIRYNRSFFGSLSKSGYYGDGDVIV